MLQFNQVLQEVATFYTQIMQAYHSNYGMGTVTFTHNPTTEQIFIGVNIHSQHVLSTSLMIEHRSGQWYVNGTPTDMYFVNPMLHNLFRRVHLGTVKTLEFLESKRGANNWTISYDNNNIIKVACDSMQCNIRINQNTPITETAARGIFEIKTHKTGITSIEDIKALVDASNTPMEISP